MSDVATSNYTGRHLEKHPAVTQQIEPLENLSAVKIKKAVRSLVMAVLFLAGCSSSGSTNTHTTNAKDTCAENVIIVNGYALKPGAYLPDSEMWRRPTSTVTVIPQNQSPPYNYLEGDDPEPPSPGIGNDSENDYGFDDGPCYGDCNDMDNDGRTWDDYEADGDGRYESP